MSWFGLTLIAMISGAEPLTVLIDAGHGGRDHGTARGGVTESAITLGVARQLAAKLRGDGNFRVHLTRDRDEFLNLDQRTALARRLKADVFLSLHVNASSVESARGAEFYFQNQLAPAEESMYLAHRENEFAAIDRPAEPYDVLPRPYPPEVVSIVTDLLDSVRIVRSSKLTRALKAAWRGSRRSEANGIRQAPFRVLAQTTAPATLVELGYLSNAEDFVDLNSPRTQGRIVDDLYRGLKSYVP